MCETCAAYAAQVADREIECSKEGCEGKWVWSRFAQVEAWLRASDQEPKLPRGLCGDCRKEVDDQEDRLVPCRVRGCAETWLWPARQQIPGRG
jgi:hypothetical protein